MSLKSLLTSSAPMPRSYTGFVWTIRNHSLRPQTAILPDPLLKFGSKISGVGGGGGGNFNIFEWEKKFNIQGVWEENFNILGGGRRKISSFNFFILHSSSKFSLTILTNFTLPDSIRTLLYATTSLPLCCLLKLTEEGMLVWVFGLNHAP